ncbi:hypothetical protein [Hufsiella ginkgonis]|uniref:hypothetical protein n=1 Tax=Hufsiella ginkgonis TaxID=2695274 RepID=UPI001926F569|nr:hypothetical protein [Hufsiella ginkgonis]
MFKQFIQSIAGSQVYVLSSLWLFLAFFVIVAVLLVRMKKSHTGYMSQLPLSDDPQ